MAHGKRNIRPWCDAVLVLCENCGCNLTTNKDILSFIKTNGVRYEEIECHYAYPRVTLKCHQLPSETSQVMCHHWTLIRHTWQVQLHNHI